MFKFNRNNGYDRVEFTDDDFMEITSNLEAWYNYCGSDFTFWLKEGLFYYSEHNSNKKHFIGNLKDVVEFLLI